MKVGEYEVRSSEGVQVNQYEASSSHENTQFSISDPERSDKVFLPAGASTATSRSHRGHTFNPHRDSVFPVAVHMLT